MQVRERRTCFVVDSPARAEFRPISRSAIGQARGSKVIEVVSFVKVYLSDDGISYDVWVS